MVGRRLRRGRAYNAEEARPRWGVTTLAGAGLDEGVLEREGGPPEGAGPRGGFCVGCGAGPSGLRGCGARAAWVAAARARVARG